MNISIKELGSFFDSLREFLKGFHQVSKRLQIPLPILKIEDLQIQRTTSLIISWKLSLNIQTEKIVYHSDLNTSFLPSLPSKSSSYTVISSNLQKLSTLIILKLTGSTRTDITLQPSVNQLGAKTMCCTSNFDWQYAKAKITLMKMYIVRTKCVLGKFLCTKGFF